MFEIGSSLRQAREYRGLELADVERETRIRVKYLSALEEERFEALPGDAYVRGFMRTYAELVGLDADMLVEEYNERFAPAEDELPPLPQRPVGGAVRLRISRPVAGALVALAAVVVVVWQLGFSGPRRAANATTTHATTISPVAKRPPPTRTTTHAVTTAPEPATIVIRATRGDCWVEVRFGSPTGQVVYERVLDEGGTLRFGLKRKLWVRLGAPWNVDVTARGKQRALPSGGQPTDFVAG